MNDSNVEHHSDALLKVQTPLKEILEKLTELSKEDLTNVHVSHEWSWVPYVKDHLDFLIEQVGGLLDNLKGSPPPVDPSVDS